MSALVFMYLWVDAGVGSSLVYLSKDLAIDNVIISWASSWWYPLPLVGVYLFIPVLLGGTLLGALVLWRNPLLGLLFVELAVLPLPAVVLKFDPSEFFLHVANFQAGTPFVWFNNFDLSVCLAVMIPLTLLSSRSEWADALRL